MRISDWSSDVCSSDLQASDILGGEPVNIYRRLDGSLVARWAHSASLVTDAVYFRQELWLEFGSDGKFDRVVKKVNIHLGAHAAIEPLPLAPSPMAASRATSPPPVAPPATPFTHSTPQTLTPQDIRKARRRERGWR